MQRGRVNNLTLPNASVFVAFMLADMPKFAVLSKLPTRANRNAFLSIPKQTPRVNTQNSQSCVHFWSDTI